jgi:ubiquinone biosynthesis protein UbiJ
VILENGNLAIATENSTADATITISPSLALRLMAKDEAAKLQVVIEGDTHLAGEFAKVLTDIVWDYEDDLSKFIGEIAAYKFGSIARDTTKSVKETSVKLTEMLSEYWQEQMPLIAKKQHVEEFNTEVDALRADVARFEKKLAKLTQSASQHPDLKGTAVDSTD